MKKLLALLLALSMVLGCVGALAEGEAPAAEKTSEELLAELPAVNYTYRNNTSTFPTNWNPHQYKTAGDNSYVMTYISDSLFAFDYNDTMDSYELKPRMAVDKPVDVTADYVGEQWGIAEGDESRAWKYTLRQDLKWQDGTPINANTFVYSMLKQINPAAQNYRADSLYSGSAVIHNAEAYLKQGSLADTSYSAMMAIDGTDLDGFLAAHGEEKGYIDWNNSYGDTYDWNTKTWTGSAESAVVETPLTVKELYDFYTVGEGAVYCTWADDATKAAWALDELFLKHAYPEMPAENVGVQAVSEYEIVFILDKPLAGFQLLYQTDFPLVHQGMYEACESVVDGVYTNSYGTTAETTMSYGPYLLAQFQTDKQITLEKNPNWWGYSDPAFEGCYQTERISTAYVAESSTAFEMFLNGQLDTIGLDKDHIADYITSDYTYFDEGASVFAVALNPNLEAMTTNQQNAGANINKTILTLKSFRMAISLGLDRSAFIAAADPVNQPAFGLYGNTIVADPETATFYRDTAEAKQVLVDFWGLTDDVGEGKLYADNDEAIASITGFNPEMAKEYFNKAYDEAIAAGLMTENDTVQIIIGLPSERPFYTSGYEYIVNNYTELVKGTKLEGKLTFVKDATVGNGFGDALRANQVDMLFGVGWSGSTFDPYGLMEAFVSPNYQYDAGTDYTQTPLTVTLGDKTYTASVVDWQKMIIGEKLEVQVEGGEAETLSLPESLDPVLAGYRMKALAALENIVLQNYNFIPVMGDYGAHLKGMKVEYPTDEEIFPMSYGGIQYYTYNYTDAEWDAFVAQQGGTLNYK